MPLFTIYNRIPFIVNCVSGPIISYISVVMNVCIFWALFDKKLKSPAAVLMQGLAVADAFTALCTYGFEPIFALKYEKIGQDDSSDSAEVRKFAIERNITVIDYTFMRTVQFLNWTWKNYSVEEIKQLVYLRYPYCVFHYFVSQFADNFHLVSLLLTSSLGMQKLLAVAWPIWSHTQITNKRTIIVCCTCFAISMAINIPKLFVVKIFAQENNSMCMFSTPYKGLENYVLTFHPVLSAAILIIAVSTMLISTCYIIIILLRRKYIRGHASSSKYEKKSCTLILCLMIVFLILEVPRLYLNITLIDTYKGDLDQENIAWKKVESEIVQQITKCYTANEQDFMSRTLTDVELLSNCVFDEKDVTAYKRYELKLEMDYYIYAFYNGYRDNLRSTLRLNYRELIDDIIQKFTSMLEYLVRQNFVKWDKINFCSKRWGSELFWGYPEIFEPCDDAVLTMLTENIPFLILGSSPFSEPLNYFLNIIWGHLSISLNQLKLLIEILKICTVLGCLSNFFIYVAMSEKLREELLRKLHIWKPCKKSKGLQNVNTNDSSSKELNKINSTYL